MKITNTKGCDYLHYTNQRSGWMRSLPTKTGGKLMSFYKLILNPVRIDNFHFDHCDAVHGLGGRANSHPLIAQTE